MLSEPRPIYFETELKFLAFDETQFGKSHVRKLYAALCSGHETVYENLDMQAVLPTLSTNRAGGGVSSCAVGPDTITIKEDNPGYGITEFGMVIEHVLRGIDEILDDDKSPLLIGQKTRVRALSQPHGHEDSVDLLAGKLAQVMDRIGPFGRPPAWFGLRFRFPPMQWESKDQDGDVTQHDEQNLVTLRLETYAQDISQVWMEVTSFEFFREALDVSDHSRVVANVQETYDFLDRGRRFLNQYDDLGKNGKQGGDDLSPETEE